MNSLLLKKAKWEAKKLNYKYSGYTYKGEVRVKKSDAYKFINIRSDDDLYKIV